jgi:NADH dehydrogenase FAD-containing subunit
MKKQKAVPAELSERIVIVGGGFAGVTLAERLEHLLPSNGM